MSCAGDPLNQRQPEVIRLISSIIENLYSHQFPPIVIELIQITDEIISYDIRDDLSVICRDKVSYLLAGVSIGNVDDQELPQLCHLSLYDLLRF